MLKHASFRSRLGRLPMALVLLTAIGCGGCGGNGTEFIAGTATLPECTDAPVTDLDGTAWGDNGTVTIQSGSCAGATEGDVFESCGLTWELEQNGNEVSIVVDGEYRLEARFCGDQLHLRGGWWLPVQDAGQCTYDDDSAAEVRIVAGGNVLTYTEQGDFGTELTGTLKIRGSGCQADYDVFFIPAP